MKLTFRARKMVTWTCPKRGFYVVRGNAVAPNRITLSHNGARIADSFFEGGRSKLTYTIGLPVGAELSWNDEAVVVVGEVTRG